MYEVRYRTGEWSRGTAPPEATLNWSFLIRGSEEWTHTHTGVESADSAISDNTFLTHRRKD